ncbi:hypothetical protein H1C71_003610 [Ictidomys tridecemlineatus]|nr:hypothetical protein H1C71_003610 [Ictidomys tridecemlineatus]
MRVPDCATLWVLLLAQVCVQAPACAMDPAAAASGSPSVPHLSPPPERPGGMETGECSATAPGPACPSPGATVSLSPCEDQRVSRQRHVSQVAGVTSAEHHWTEPGGGSPSRPFSFLLERDRDGSRRRSWGLCQHTPVLERQRLPWWGFTQLIGKKLKLIKTQ